MKRQEIQKLVRKEVALLVEDDLLGATENLKSPWEQMESEADVNTANRELKAIVKWLLGRGK